MVLDFKRYKLVLAIVAIIALSGCVKESDMLTASDVDIVAIQDPVSSSCRDMLTNESISTLLNLHEIQWEKRTRVGNTFVAVNPNVNGNDSLIITVPFILDDVFTNYQCSILWKANKYSDDKIVILKDDRYFGLSIDSRGDSLTMVLCNKFSRTTVAGDDVDITSSTVVSFPK